MSEFVYILANFVDVLLTVLYFAIFIRVILSWLPLDEDGPFVSFVYLVTDPIILPIRALLERMGLFQNSPIDFSTLIAMILVMLVQTLIGGFNCWSRGRRRSSVPDWPSWMAAQGRGASALPAI